MGPSRLGCAIVPKMWECPHACSVSWILIVYSIISPMQANWKPDLQAVAGKVGISDVQSSPHQGETGSWAVLLTLFWTRENSYYRGLCIHIELSLGIVWSWGICECWALSAPTAGWLGSQSLCGSYNIWGARCVDMLLPGRSWRSGFTAGWVVGRW